MKLGRLIPRGCMWLPALSSFLIAILTNPLPAENSQNFRFVLPPGPFAVGLAVMQDQDRSRNFTSKPSDLIKANGGRPIQYLVWYPSVRVKRAAMTLGGYYDLAKTETSFDHEDAQSTTYVELMRRSPRLSQLTFLAVRDAKEVAGHFPILVYAPSLSEASSENIDLCEFLASQGYVVAASSSVGADSRPMTIDDKGAVAQAEDILYVMRRVASRADVDGNLVGVVGYSWGGLANIIAAQRDSSIKALVCLDGSARYYPDVLAQVGAHPEGINTPLLFFTAGEATLEELAALPLANKARLINTNLLRSWISADLIVVRMPEMAHEMFSSTLQRDEEFHRRFSSLARLDYSFEDGVSGYGWVARYTLAFLDAYLKKDPRSAAYLRRSAAENHVPKHMLKVELSRGLHPDL